MKTKGLIAVTMLAALCGFGIAEAQVAIPKSERDDAQKIMSHAYWALWNNDEQKRIDDDIARYRMAEAVIDDSALAKGTIVEVEQLSHDFFFGAHMFNFNQLGTPARNRRYRELWGTLFNSATVPFYWKTFEMQPGRPRFREE